MKARHWLGIACGLLLLVSITAAPRRALGFSGATPDPLELIPFGDPQKPTELEQAYVDAFSILRHENSCSQFYGGSSAIAALNELAQQIRPTHLDHRIGLMMSGPTTVVTSAATGFTFRLFDKAEVNLDGPFYRSRVFFPRGRSPQIGPFDPSTREARVTTILHELGHLIRRSDGQWVLPNDGESLGASEANTRRVLDVCAEQIKAVHNFSFAAELDGARSEARAASTMPNGSGD